MKNRIWSSRFATVAAVTFLVGGALWLGGCPADDDDDDGGGGGTTIINNPPANPTPNPVPSDAPLSAIVAGSFENPGNTGIAAVDSAQNIADYVKALVANAGTLPAGFGFPLANSTDDTVRAITGLNTNVVVSWLDPLTVNPDGPRFGANCDYVAYFGEGWNNDWGTGGAVIDGTGSAPQWNGSGESAWMWVNHEYVSNNVATTTSAPDGQYLTLARFMRNHGAFTHDVTSNTWTQFQVNQFNYAVRREVGGSWLRIEKDPYTGRWNVDRKADNKRYDATSNTLLRITGYNMASADHDDYGNVLPSNIVVGIQSDCSGGQTPWGTVFTAEENVQFQYGNLENCWTSNQLFTHGTTGDFAPGANVTPDFTTDTTQLFGLHSDPTKHHAKDAYGFVVEMDPGEFPSLWYESVNGGGDGRGHRKMGNFGRARWENVATVVNSQWRLTPGQPIVLYSGDDTRSGRIYKFVSSQNYDISMTRAEIRALLDSGSTYVAHFGNLDNDTGTTVGGNNPGLASGTFGQGNEVGEGQGQWILMSTANGNQSAPNAQAPVPSGHTILDPTGTGTVTLPDMTVGQALTDVNYNGIGGFPNNNLVYAALFTASCKIGIKELNRPEDLEWDPVNRILYVAFTNHNRRTALDDNGVLRDPATHAASTSRADTTGTIFGIIESDRNNPAASSTFTFWSAWQGTNGSGPHDTSCPDNIMLDKEGGVWFGTDGNFGVNGTADAVYYLAINGTGAGTAWRVMAGPSDSEFTGPCFSSDLRTLFGAVQHPGESETSVWPPR